MGKTTTTKKTVTKGNTVTTKKPTVKKVKTNTNVLSTVKFGTTKNINSIITTGNGVVTKYTLQKVNPITSGSIVNNSGKTVNLNGYTCYTLTNPTIQQHRGIKNVNVLINNNGSNVIITSTRVNGNVLLYNHLPLKLVNQLQINHLTQGK